MSEQDMQKCAATLLDEAIFQMESAAKEEHKVGQLYYRGMRDGIIQLVENIHLLTSEDVHNIKMGKKCEFKEIKKPKQEVSLDLAIDAFDCSESNELFAQVHKRVNDRFWKLAKKVF